jgi:hypothetical protein
MGFFTICGLQMHGDLQHPFHLPKECEFSPPPVPLRRAFPEGYSVGKEVKLMKDHVGASIQQLPAGTDAKMKNAIKKALVAPSWLAPSKIRRICLMGAV